MLASSVPTCQAYDPAFAFEMATIIRDGLHRMYGGADHETTADDGGFGEAIFYYLTLYNENYEMPALPDHVDPKHICEGLYRFEAAPEGDGPDGHDPVLRHRLPRGSRGSRPVGRALRRAVRALERNVVQGAARGSTVDATMEPDASPRRARQSRSSPAGWPRATGPIIAVTDFMKMVPDQVAPFVPDQRPFVALGTDGFGRSDTREALRRFFETDAAHVQVAVLAALAQSGAVDRSVVADCLKRNEIEVDAPDPRSR